MPVHKHDCDACTFLGNGKVQGTVYDFYTCPRGLAAELGVNCLARYGDDGPEYYSLSCSRELWDEALAARDAGKDRPSMYHPWMPELLECWRQARVYTFPGDLAAAEDSSRPERVTPGLAYRVHVLDSAGCTCAPAFEQVACFSTDGSDRGFVHGGRFREGFLVEGREGHAYVRYRAPVPGVHDLRCHIPDGRTDLRPEKVNPVEYRAMEQHVLAGLMEKQGKVLVDRGELQRLRDLVRHQRGALHDAGLVTDEEYAEMAADHGAVARLEGYDAVRAAHEADLITDAKMASRTIHPLAARMLEAVKADHEVAQLSMGSTMEGISDEELEANNQRAEAVHHAYQDAVFDWAVAGFPVRA